MPQLLIKHSNRPADKFDLVRIRTTIGRSARSDICLPDPFASRIHAEVRKEGDRYWLQDLGSANGTRYNSAPVSAPVPLINGGEIQIGETSLVFDEQKAVPSRSAPLISEDIRGSEPAVTIALSPASSKITAGLLDSITDRGLAGQVPGSAPVLSASGVARQQIDGWGLMNKVVVGLLGSARLEETLQTVAALVFEAVPAERCMIMFRDAHAAADDLNVRIAVAKVRGQEAEAEDVRVSRSVLHEVLTEGKSVLTSDAQHDPRFSGQTIALQGIRSVLAVPLAVNENVFGLIYADSPTYEVNFTEQHLQILTTLSSVAAIRVENARLLEESFEGARMEQELKFAIEIQQNLQPNSAPPVEGYEFQGISFSCYEIGGDYYDFIERPDGKMLIALGDVSGKGTAAALLMSSLHAAIHGQVAAKSTLPETVDAVNSYLAANTPSNRFVTLFLAELDPPTGALTFINAGHNPPLVVHPGGKAEQLASGGFPLGILGTAVYEVGQAQLEPGGVLVIYSDGVSEAANPEGEEFGLERLADVVKSHLGKSAAGLRDRVESALSDFSKTAPAGDDITLVIVKRKEV
ncbi:MAG TPA: SpoIIE family protein phosphatase [Pyrinomonadaceae bacterium]|jgi:serine phosphatase RsbU (regulator of sigma subunit)|nr:SpoIIE family protein phosphatase [Pyrinomonadaceae bacterium]